MDRGEKDQEIRLAERNEILNPTFPPGFMQLVSGRTRKAPWIVPAALSFFLASCGSTSAFYAGVENDIAGGKYIAALEQVRANRPAYGDKSTVLYNLDVGLLFHYAGVPDSSTLYFFAAEKEIGELYTKSVSLAAASILLNDNVLPYEGEDFEKVLVNVFLALNYAQKGEPDDALVEARKVDEKLREYARQYEGKNKYSEDAFIRYVTGVLYESRGEINDAFIAYRKALETYRVYAKEYGTAAPSFLLDDLVRTATLMSFDDEAASYRAMGGKGFTAGGGPSGSVIVLAYSGRGASDGQHPGREGGHPHVPGGTAEVRRAAPAGEEVQCRCSSGRRGDPGERDDGGRGGCHGDRCPHSGRQALTCLPEVGGACPPEVPCLGEGQVGDFQKQRQQAPELSREPGGGPDGGGDRAGGRTHMADAPGGVPDRAARRCARRVYRARLVERRQIRPSRRTGACPGGKIDVPHCG